MQARRKLTPVFSVGKARQLQKRLSKQILLEDRLPSKIDYVGGVDAAYLDDTSIGAAVVLHYDSLEIIESKTSRTRTEIPYISTLLAFRELPAAILSVKRLRTKPDILLVDGHGYAHPYRFGFASHLGMRLGIPTIGVAKKRLIGNPEQRSEGGVSFLRDREEIVGAAVVTKMNSSPIYVSVGHMVSLSTAISIVKHCTRNRIPEPILRAHQAAAEEKRKINIT